MGFEYWTKTLLIFSRLIPRKKNAILICNGKNSSLTMNKLHFVNFLNECEANYTVLSGNRKLNKELSDKGINVTYSYSFAGWRKFFSYKVVIISHGVYDIKPFCLDLKSQLVVNLWHGTAIKKIGNFINESYNDGFEFSYITVSSEIEGKKMMKAFGLDEEKILLTGLCKNDSILKQKRVPNREILYLPTFRDWTEKHELLPFPDRNLKELDLHLLKIGYKLIIKPHKNMVNQKFYKEFQNIRIIESVVDAQDLILNSEILITDYSGAYIDYLLLDRPIIFYPYDLEKYSKDRGFIYDYDEITPGFHVKSQREMTDAINQYIKDKTIYSKERKKIKKMFHKHYDSKACDRIYKVIEGYYK